MALNENKTSNIVLTKTWFGSALDTARTTDLFVAETGASYQVVSVTERHNTVGSTTIMLVGALGSTPMGSGTNLLASTIDCTAAVDVVRSGVLLGSAVLTGSSVLTSTAAFPVIGPGDGLGIRYTTASNRPPDGVLTVVLQRI